MPIGKKRQTDTMLYTLLIFVGLFIAATVFSVIYYLKAQNYKTDAAAMQTQINELATSSELRKIGTLIGAKQRRKSRLGTMLDYLDEMVALVTGTLPEETSAEVKVNTANRKVKDTLELLAQRHLATKNVTPKAPNNKFVELLVKQQFAAVTENFDETMKNTLPPEKLEETWKLTTRQMGPFKQQIGLRTEKQLDYDIVFITCEFEKGHLDIKVAYNDKKQVAGLFFVPTPSEVLESYQQTPELVTREQPYIEIDDPNTIGLIRVIEKLKTNMDNTTNANLALKEQLDQLQNRFDDAMATSFEKEQALLAEKEKYQHQLNDIEKNYNELKALMEQTTEQQVQILSTQVDEERANLKKLNQKLLKTQAELGLTKDRMERAQEKLQALVPPPDSEVAAYKPDGKIILLDHLAKIIHLNIGTDDRVYRGLTFSVYDKNMPIPKSGKGKAEIEVFNVGKNTSVARTIRSEEKNPIALNDIVANLIWDSDKINVFVVAGEFDLDEDGVIDYNAMDKINALIEKWGGRVADAVSIDTDFLLLGTPPKVRRKPTFEEMEVDPMAMEKYEASLQKLAHYKQVQTQAQALFIPIFNLERFLYFIGYKTQSSRAGAF